jgi:hypothetical protein
MSFFYQQILLSNVTAFGDCFNNITLRRNLSDETFKEINVPISYSNSAKYIERFLKRGDDSSDIKDLINTTVPRMGFKLLDLKYDSQRKLNKMFKILMKNDIQTIDSIDEYTIENFADVKVEDLTTDKLVSVYNPVPYILTFQLYILTNKEEDSNQIIEQILPKFTPEYNLPVKYMFGPILKDTSAYYKGRTNIIIDSPLVLENVSKEDNYDGDFSSTSRRIVHTLTFSLRCKFFTDFSRESIIKIVDFKFGDFDSLEISENQKIYSMPSDEDMVVGVDRIVDLEKLYYKFYDDMFQDPYQIDNTNIGDENDIL